GQRPAPGRPGACRSEVREGKAGRATQGGARREDPRGRRVIMRDRRSTGFDDSSANRRTAAVGQSLMAVVPTAVFATSRQAGHVARLLVSCARGPWDKL